ncbi:MAG: translation initiation factor eIF-2B [Blastocatellia bacterium]|nr:translation initiation factor eIF-2B [Blastocatellia bacterium]MCS7157558.1 translation initiation factor eIF-2B [Blastocatellia bacterium]MCX7753510.1 translation initiation factor eIF-2B [Blastocatellia bacterium]MDW8166926.1 translation initiation factor eIF-2B [Acidobacteriota bacterium]MDW8257503.1 translation initiation factor eIF-2B [Acidobacteriota bacterium]
MRENPSTLSERVRAIVEDHLSGATTLTEQLAEVMRDALSLSSAATPEDLGMELLDIGERVIRAHPNMASLVHLVNTVVRATAGIAMLEEARSSAQEALNRFHKEWREHTRALEIRASDLIPDGARVLTHSFSATVLAALRAAHARGRSFSIVCTESRPLCEGRRFAEQALALGLPVTLIVDAAMAEWAGRCTLALVGADCVAPEGVVNKIGTRLLALAARECGIPLYVLAESSKFFPALLSASRSQSPVEIWETPPLGLTIWNEYFETTPLDLFTGVLTERGLLSPEDVRRHIRGIVIDARLWSRLRLSPSATNSS